MTVLKKYAIFFSKDIIGAVKNSLPFGDKPNASYAGKTLCMLEFFTLSKYDGKSASEMREQDIRKDGIYKVKKSMKNLTLSAIFIAIGIVLPFFTGQIPAIGNMLLPMHIPVFLCGLICGWQYGAAVGVILPLFRSLLFGAPVMFPTASAMALELLTYGLVAGVLYNRSRRQCILSLYGSMLIAMICGRAVWGAAQMIFLGIGGKAFTWEAFAAGAFLNAIPGIVLQLVFIPAVMIALNKTGLVLFKNHRSAESAKES